MGCFGNFVHPPENQAKIVPNVSISTTIDLHLKSLEEELAGQLRSNNSFSGLLKGCQTAERP
jgi:hypothetical protein